MNCTFSKWNSKRVEIETLVEGFLVTYWVFETVLKKYIPDLAGLSDFLEKYFSKE